MITSDMLPPDFLAEMQREDIRRAAHGARIAVALLRLSDEGPSDEPVVFSRAKGPAPVYTLEEDLAAIADDVILNGFRPRFEPTAIPAHLAPATFRRV